MTALVSWVAYDQRGPASAYLASDSRISWFKRDRIVGHWDGVRKCYASSLFPDAFAYVGNVMFPSLVLSQFVDALDSGFVVRPDCDLRTRHSALHDALQVSLDMYNAPTALPPFQIVHVGREGQGMESTFSLHSMVWDGRDLRTAVQGSLDQPSVLELGVDEVRSINDPVIEGSGREGVQREIKTWERSEHAHTSRAVFSALCDSVRDPIEASVGGAVQLVGLYRIGNGRTFGVVHDQMPTVLGLPLLYTPDSADEYRNDLFERVDSGGVRLAGAKAHKHPRQNHVGPGNNQR